MREQARHSCEHGLEVLGVVRIEPAVVDVQAVQARVCEPGEEEGLFGLEYDVVAPHEALQCFADVCQEHDTDTSAAREGEALELVAEAGKARVTQLELVAVERAAFQVAHRGELAQEVRVDVELGVAEVERDYLVFGEGEEVPEAVGEELGVENGVRDVQLLGPTDSQAGKDEVEDLGCLDEVAAAREPVQVDAEHVDALEARSHALHGLDVPFVEAGEVA